MRITFRVWVLIFFLIASLATINPTGYFSSGVLIKSVATNSTAAEAGISAGEIIKAINGQSIKSVVDYSTASSAILGKIQPVNWTIKADDLTFEYSSVSLNLEVNENLTITALGDIANNSGLQINFTLQEINGRNISSLNKFASAQLEFEPKQKIKITTNKAEYDLLTTSLGLTIVEIPKSNLKAGLDLQGGAKALVKPEQNIDAATMDDLIAITQERLNVYGIADIVVRPVRDLSGNNYMVIEVAGATPSELKELISNQGKFEAKIGNDTVFIGGKKDIIGVCRNDASCSGIRKCVPPSPSQNGYNCRFDFVIYLSELAAERQANLTSSLSINVSSDGSRMLSKPLDLYLDDNLVDSLQISSDLKGKASTQISIQGPGFGTTQQEAFENAKAAMNKLQTVLKTGSLPFKLEIVKLDNISPLLGKEFIANILFAAFAALLAVSIIVFFRYRTIIYTIPIMATVICEVFITLGIAALIQWNLDLASIAGIIAAIGTGVNDQLVILDESQFKVNYSVKEKIKRAFSIILGAFATVFVAMLPLLWAGAGMMKGFALTTLIGITVGVLVTRPAFADVIGQIVKE